MTRRSWLARATRNTRARVLTTIALAVVLPLAAPSLASASEPAKIETYIYLSPDPVPSMDTAVLGSGTIYLAAGNYGWTHQFFAPGNVLTARNIYLAAGTYTWQCTIKPLTGNYRANCTLDKPGTPRAAIGVHFLHVGGTYYWASTLTQI